jgi:glycosyltransferase involved in cell wall biosynthesis
MLNAGGAERVMVDLSNILHGNGVNTSVLTIVKPGVLVDGLDKGVKRFNLGRKRRYSLVKMYQFYKIAKDFDIIHVHMRYNLKYVWLIKEIFGLKSKIVFHDHYGQINSNQTISFFLKKAMFGAYYVGVSQQLCAWAKAVGLNYERIFSLDNTIVKSNLENQIDLEVTGIRFILVSNFRRQKNIKFAVDIIESLSRHSDVKLDIYGQFSDGDYLEEIKSLISLKNLTNNIRIIHDCTDIQMVLQNYNLALHTAKSETGPLVLLEYMSQGLAFISYKTGEVVEQIADEFPEFVMNDFNLDEWVTRIEKMIHSDLEITQENMMNFFEDNYSEKEYFNRCINIYQSVLNS